jgi:amino acid adenylation domain-containing protein
LLYRHSGQSDVLVGTPIANRNRREIEPLVGFFVNTLVMRSRLSGGASFNELLGQVRETALGAYAHQDVPFEKLVEELQPERSLSHSPLFQVMFILQNTPTEALEMPGLTLGPAGEDGDAPLARFDLTLEMSEDGERLGGSLEYNTDLFDKAAVERLIGHFRMLLAVVAADREQTLDGILLLTEAERRQALVEWNETRADYPAAGAGVQQLFEAQAGRTPGAVAIEFRGARLTYAELNARADRLARRLRGLGVGAEVLVGICVERSVEMVVGLLGILKAGGAYVPLDPAYPLERLRYMAASAGASVMLTAGGAAAVAAECAGGARVVRLDEEWAESGEPCESGGAAPFGDGLAYVIYTSGSTGQPKGAMNTHAGILNRLLWMEETYRLTADDRVLQKTPFSFDVSVWEFFWPLMTGARLVVAEPGGHQDSRYLVELIREAGITVLHFVPSMLQVFIEEPGVERCVSIRQIVSSGEALSASLQRRVQERLPWAELDNLYGPTEAAVDVTRWRCERGSERAVVPIGRPIANTQMYVLDTGLEPAPIGTLGELYIGGVNVGRGYLGRPALTAERFVPHPHGERGGERLYRTGDLGRYLPDGGIEYAGRVDHQVKVRGNRIELGEVEAALEGHRGVREAVVCVAGGDDLLVGYVVKNGEASATAEELREHLRRRLPEYMVPTFFMELPELPLSPNGKIDRRALPQPGAAERARKTFVAARTPVEEALASIWSEVLGVEQVGVGDNFFDLGGHSLLATRVVSRVREVFQVEVPLKKFFEAATVRELGQHVQALLQTGSRAEQTPLLHAPRDGKLPLSYEQYRLWFLEQLEPNKSFYNCPLNIRFSGRLNVAALERTWNELVRRHEVLRTSISKVEDVPVQIIAPPSPFELRVEDLSGLGAEEQAAAAGRRSAEEARRPFDLSAGPLLRVKLLRLGEAEHVMLLTMHHLIIDAWSTALLVEEVGAIYRAFEAGEPSPLAEPRIQYADYAAWQRGWLAGEASKQQLAYWRGQLGGALPALKLPADRARPATPNYEGDSYRTTLPPALLASLKELSRAQGATLFMTLLAAFKTLLFRYTLQEDIVVGTPSANRNRAELEGVIGFFVNQLVMRTDLSGNPPFRELLRRVRDVALGAYAHQDIPVERLVEELRPERDQGYQPLFNVSFNLLNTPKKSLELPGVVLSLIPVGRPAARFDLTLLGEEAEEGLRLTWEYRTALFSGERVRQMHEHFEALLRGIVAEPQARLRNLEMMTAGEKERLAAEQKMLETVRFTGRKNLRRKITYT